jgi:hypothetical protein
MLKECCDGFDQALTVLGAIHITEFVRCLSPVLRGIHEAFTGEAYNWDKLANSIDHCINTIPTSEDAGVREIGCEAATRDWVATTLKLKEFLGQVKLSAQHILGAGNLAASSLKDVAVVYRGWMTNDVAASFTLLHGTCDDEGLSGPKLYNCQSVHTLHPLVFCVCFGETCLIIVYIRVQSLIADLDPS